MVHKGDTVRLSRPTIQPPIPCRHSRNWLLPSHYTRKGWYVGREEDEYDSSVLLSELVCGYTLLGSMLLCLLMYNLYHRLPLIWVLVMVRILEVAVDFNFFNDIFLGGSLY